MSQIAFELSPFESGGRTYYLGAATARELNAVCRVPSYSNDSTHAELGKKALEMPDDDQEWQRPLDLPRRDDIMRFSGGRTAGIANAVTLYLPTPEENMHVREDSVRIEDASGGRKRLVIDFLGFLKEMTTDDGRKFYSERDGDRDLRPIIIVDGQHRIRGVSASATGQDMSIPFVLIPPEEGMMGAARRFSEMNTSQEPVNELHDLYVRYWFGLGSDNIKKAYLDFRRLDDSSFYHERARANRLAYKMAVALTSDEESQLHDRIQVLPNAQRSEVSETVKILKGARSWFLGTGPYSKDNDVEFDEAYEQVRAYFSAFSRVCNHEIRGVGDWADKEPRWIGKGTRLPRDGSRPCSMREGPFNAILWLFPTAHDRFEQIMEEDPSLDIEEAFCKALRPLAWVDWNNSRMSKVYASGGEPPQRSLYSWLSWAVSNGKMYRLDEVMSNDSALCVPGKGILAPPNPELVSIETDSVGAFWPSAGRPLTLFSRTPPNTYFHCDWTVSSGKEGATRLRTRGETKRTRDPGRGFAKFVLRHKQWMDDEEVIQIEVKWSNAPGDMVEEAATHVITIRRDPGSGVSEDGDEGDSAPPAAPKPGGGGPPEAPKALISHEHEKAGQEGLRESNPDGFAVYKAEKTAIMVPRPPKGDRKTLSKQAPRMYQGGSCLRGFHGICDKQSCKACRR